jgi:hypothetical protein
MRREAVRLALVVEVFGLHGFDLAVTLDDNSESVLLVAQHRLAAQE